MIPQNFNRMCFAMILFCLIVKLTIQTPCSCSQIEDLQDCSKSPKCMWINSRCSNNPNYTTTNSNEYHCFNYPQEECRSLRQCVFHQGECKNFTNCQMLQKQSCQSSSYFCVPDGSQCIEKTDCKSYLTQVACQNRNLQNEFCNWNNNTCQVVKECDELPKSLKTDKQCRTELPHCTVAMEGGCIDSPTHCEQHKIESQCHTNYDNSIKCFWNDSQQACYERLCKNGQFKTKEECQQIKDDCITDGVQCIDLSDCFSYNTQLGCKQDKEGNSCAFVNGKCFTKSCATAPEYYTLLQQCSQYLIGTQCVPRLNGGCKDFPNICSEFEISNSCLQLQNGTECFWNLNQQCKIKECTDAPFEYQYQDCLKWMSKSNCIAQSTGGCTERPALCEEIEDPQSCDYNLQQEKCFYEITENKCKTLNCQNLRLPAYSNHNQCQEKLASCIFSSISGGCLEFTCKNIIDPLGCYKDSSGFPCILNGCVTKSFLNAAVTLESHTQCEQWNSNSTVSKNGKGCEQKYKICHEYMENQCYFTLNGNQCIWKGGQCLDIECIDAPAASYDTHEKCLFQWIVLLGKCTLAYSGSGCQLWPSTCVGITQSNLCLIGTVNGESCSWFNNSCQVKTCSNAPNSYKSINQCSKWLINCTFNNSMCVDNSTIQCNSMKAFTSHSECYEWNSSCTIAPRILEQGCEEKRLCSEYKQQSQCKMGSDGSLCQWNVSNLSCQNLTSCNSIVSKDYSQESCESFNDNCTISEITYGCIGKFTYCQNSVLKQECLATFNEEQCTWNSTLNDCEQSQCTQNTTATTEKECLKYYKKGYCELKINANGTYGIGCELRKTNCSQIIEELKCNKTYLQNGSMCYFRNGSCLSSQTCSNVTLPTQATTNEECQRLYHYCQLSPSGIGCVRMTNCSNIPDNVCNMVELTRNQYCHFDVGYGCLHNYFSQQFYTEQACINGHLRKRKLVWIYGNCKLKECSDVVHTPNDQNCQDYQSYCRYNGSTGCTENDKCLDVTDQILCDKATDKNGTFCAWDPVNSTCLSNDLCENQKSANGVDKDKICKDWQQEGSSITCVANPNGNGCIQMESCDQIKIYIQCKAVSGCYWVQGLQCQNSPMCHANITAISKFECKLFHPNCELNWNSERGCNYQACSQVHITQCNSIVLNNGSYCCLNGSQQCLEFTCSLLTSQSSCMAIRSNGSKCYWYGSTCNIYHCNLIQNVQNNDDCRAYNRNCQIILTLNSSSICRVKICSDYANQSSCKIDPAGVICYWDGSSCATAFGICNDYIDPIICNYSKQLNGNSCKYDQDTLTCVDCVGSSLSICFQNNCINYNGTTFTLGYCQNWLPSCTSNPLETACIDKVDCKQAPKSFTTHSQCQSYLSQCTVARNQPTCVPLPSTCNEATDIQCYFDASGNKCYWSEIINECTTLISCDQINLNVSTHSDCNSLLSSCTVNQNLHGCVSLQNCADYSEDQCYIALDDVVCSWFDSQCQDKSCTTADLVTYTNSTCRAYFNSTCSLNELGNQCIESPKTCSEYNQLQCSAPDSQNFYGIPCIVTIFGGCIEKICENSPLLLNSISLQLCESISPICFVGECRNKECSDILESTEQVCQNALPKVVKCSSTPTSCVDRAQCSDAVTLVACNFDDKGQQCEWIDDACEQKTCETAPISLKLSQECQSYFSGCIPKSQGGCMERLSCPEIEVEEECNIDNAKIQCNWDFDMQVCKYKECLPECGDGILSKGFEDCDDGNTLPYDGCYKCQIHCSLGCAKCIESQCQECEIGWRLVDKCESICGDGLVLGKEECDDMNDLPYDGCFECKFQCHSKCKFCEYGICQECNEGWHLENQECITHCGDGIMVLESEQCDDNNQYPEDGCDSNCQIEIGWTCNSTPLGQSECVKIRNPYFQLSLITTQNQPIQQVDLSFSEEMKYKSLTNQSLAQALTIQIINSNSTVNISLEIIQEPTKELQDINVRIFIQFYEYTPSPVLNVTLQNVLVNQYDAELQSFYQIIRLSTPYFINETIIKTTEKATLFNEILVYILLSIAVIALLSGKIQIFWNLLDTLQVLSYLRYINIQFPETLEIYFYVFSNLSLQPVIELMRLDEIYTIGKKKETIFIQPSGKIQMENTNSAKSGGKLINAFFLINIQSVVLVLVFGYVGYYTSKLILQKINPIRIDNYFGLKQQPIFQKIRLIILKIIGGINKQCMRSMRDFYYSGILRLLQSSVYKIVFASLLQLAHPRHDTILFIVSYYASLIALLPLIYFVGYIFSQSMSQFKIRKFSALHEGIYDHNRWSKQYYTLLTIKKIAFMLIITFCQELELVQSTLISMVSLAFLAYMYNCKPLINQSEQRKIMFTELIISINTLLFTFYQLFHYQIVFQVMPLLNIALFTSILIFQLISDIYEHQNKIVEFTKGLIKK